MAIVILMPGCDKGLGDPQWGVVYPYITHDSYLSAVRANMTGMSHMWHGYFGGSFLSFCLSPS